MPEQCYPCSLDEHLCITDPSWIAPPVQPHPVRKPQLPPPRPGWCWFDVALWTSFPSLWPFRVAYVQAASAYDAVLLLMTRTRLKRVVRARADALDGLICYTACRIEKTLQEDARS